MSKEVPNNLKPSPMTYEVRRIQNPDQMRYALASEADDLTVEQLTARAAEAQFDLRGATSKKAMIDAIRSQARGVPVTPEAENG